MSTNQSISQSINQSNSLSIILMFRLFARNHTITSDTIISLSIRNEIYLYLSMKGVFLYKHHDTHDTVMSQFTDIIIIIAR